MPEFFWWGISCSSDGRSRTDALATAGVQWEAHGPFVSIACKRDKKLTKKFFEKLGTEKGSLAQEGALEAAAQAASALGASLPGLGLAVWLTRLVTKAKKQRKIDKKLVEDVAEPGALEGRRVEKLVNNMSQLGRAKFPVVAFVEDVHLADDVLLEALGALLRRASHLLVVTTSPSKVDASPELSKLAQDLGERVLRVGDRAEAGEPFPDGAGLTELDRDACRQILLAHYPHAHDETVALLVERFSNPGALDIVCAMDKYKKEFGERGDLYIAPDQIDGLSLVIEELYEEYWKQLPPSIKLRYAIAAAISPAAISPIEGAGYHTWSAPVLDDVINRLDLAAVDELSSAVEASTDAYGWVTHVDEYLRRWAELEQHQIANKAGERVLASHTTRDKILNNLAKVVLEGASPSAHAARTVIALHAEDFKIEDAQVANAVVVALDDLGHDETAIAERIRLYEHYLDVVEQANVDAETDLEVRFNGIDAIAASGRYARAASEFAELHTSASKSLGKDHRLTVRSLYKWAVNLQDSGQDDLATDAFRWAYDESREAFGAEDPDTLDARTGLAEALEAEGHNDETIEILEEVLATRASVHGEHDPDTVASRRRLGQALRSMGHRKEALKMFRRVLEDRAKSLSEDNRDMLNARADLALALLDTNSLNAIKMLKRVLKDRAEFLGDDDPDTWESRNVLAEALLITGRGREAVALFEQVVDDRTAALGKDHPATLEARHRLADNLGYTDRHPEVINMFKQVLADRARVLGKDHPDTLTTGYSLGVALLVTGQLPQARDKFEQVRDGRARAFGEDHPDTLDARIRIAQVLVAENRHDVAIEAYNKLIADSAGVLGEFNFQTLEVRSMLADTLMRAGEKEEAIKNREQLVQDHIDTFGAKHHKTLEARKYLAIMWSMVGKHDKGAAIYKEVIEQEVEQLGNDHPEVWLSRAVRGQALMDANEFDDALRVFNRVLDDQIRVLDDANHKDILESRSRIGQALLKADRAQEAIPDLVELLTDCTNALGDDDYLTRRVRDLRDEAYMQLATDWAQRAYPHTAVEATSHPKGFIAECTAAPGAITVGRSEQEALEAMRSWLVDWASFMLRSGCSLPDIDDS